MAAYPPAKAEAADNAALLPNAELPNGSPTAEKLATWLERYPDDPRVRLHQAAAAELAQDWATLDLAVARARAALPRFRRQFTEETMTAFGLALDEHAAREALLKRLVPTRELPPPEASTEAARDFWAQHLDGWLTAYPDDPTVREHAALIETRRGHYAEADAHVVRGLQTLTELQSVLTNTEGQRSWFEGLHALLLHTLGREVEAKPEIARLCSGAGAIPAATCSWARSCARELPARGNSALQTVNRMRP